MSVTQYIGARYVPLFATPIDWDINTEYEPLTIVYTGGNSYTSRQYVPSGVDIKNTDYWALTGNYNAQIEQYRKEVSAYDARIATAEEQAGNALSLAQTNEKDIATLDSEMAGSTDSGLKSLITANSSSIASEADRATAAENAISANVESETTRATAAENAISASVQSETTRATAAEGVNSAKITALEATLNAHFPVDSNDIADGSITAPKLAPSAVSSIWQSLEIKRFDVNDNTADNTGMVVPSGVPAFAGFYIPALAILVITQYRVTDGSNGSVVLPSYVPVVSWTNTSSYLTIAQYGFLVGTADTTNKFHRATGISFDNKTVGVKNTVISNSSYPDYTMTLNGTVIFYCAPYISSTAANAASLASDYAENSGVIENV